MTERIFLLCGIPGSGKSYWTKEQADELQTSAKVISRDKIRLSMLKDGEDYFKWENAVFAQFVKEINDCISAGIPYIFIDATHLTVASRAKILNRLRVPAGVALSVEVFNTSLKTCLERNACRTGRALVPAGIIKNMARSFTEPTYEEFAKYNFSKVEIFFHNEEAW